MYKIYGIQTKWPYLVRLYETSKISYKVADTRHLVKLPDGRRAVIDHVKRDGMLGVRPIDSTGNYFPNSSTHWSMEDRLRIPEEIAISPNEIEKL